MIAVLFARSDSIYKSLPNCDVFDKDRNALNFKGGFSIVAHPPCRAWGQLRHFANPLPGEKEYARFCIREIRRNGGVLEHPKNSMLWSDMNLPEGQEVDEFGGFTLHIDQFWWGHKARKATKLYICGIDKKDVPVMPLDLGEPEYVVSRSKTKHAPRKKEISKREREATPVMFAQWLIKLAGRCNDPKPA